MTEPEFISLVTRKESPLWVSLVCYGGAAEHYKEALDWTFSIQNYKYEKHTHQISVSDAVALQREVSRASAADFYTSYRDRCETACKAVIAAAEAVRAEALAQPPSTVGAAFALFDRVLLSSLRAMPFLASLALIQTRLEADLRLGLAQDRGLDPDDPQVSEVLQTALVASRESSFVEETRDILALAIDQKAQIDIADRVRAHQENYGWLGTFTYLNEPFSEANIYDRVALAASKDPADTLERTLARAKAAGADADAAVASVRDPSVRRLLTLSRELMFWRFERVDVHFQAEVRCRVVQEALAEFAGLSRGQLVMLTYGELASWARDGGALPSGDALHSRFGNGVDYYVEDGQHRFIPAIPSPRMIDQEARARATTAGLPGSVACPGEFTGVIRIIETALDVGRVRAGDILVTSMTTPDLMTAIERCGAIVTDEGGILCHAAIISRELNIPCVIGTTNATSVFCDGDLAAVSAKGVRGTVTLLQPQDGASA